MNDPIVTGRLDRQQLSLGFEVLRPLLILAMCLAHIPLLHHYTHPAIGIDAPQSLLGPFVRDVFARATVPMLTAMSGYLAWHSFQRRSYPQFALEKIRRILLPFLLWNLIALGLVYLLFRAFGVDFGGHLERIQSTSDLVLVLLPYNAMPVNVPTYFLRDLFLILLCVPVVMLITRQRWIGLAVAIALLGLMLTVMPLFISVAGHGILHRNDMPLFFLLGFIVARHGTALPATRALPAAVVCAGVLLAGVATAVLLSQLKPAVETYLRFRPLLGLLALAALPFAASLIAAGRDRWPVIVLQRLSPYSYSIFLSHFLIAMVISANLSDPVSRWLQALQIDNWSPWWLQLAFVFVFLLLCVTLGGLVKIFHDQASRRLVHRSAREAADA